MFFRKGFLQIGFFDRGFFQIGFFSDKVSRQGFFQKASIYSFSFSKPHHRQLNYGAARNPKLHVPVSNYVVAIILSMWRLIFE